MIGLIMAGGSGTRFWPLSRKNYPKQFIRLFDNKSMIQLTYDRLLKLVNNEDIFVITTLEQHRLVQEHLPNLPKKNIILEPYAMNTSACVAYSIEYLLSLYNEQEDLLILPSDQLIENIDIFINSIQSGQQLSQDSYHVVFGIQPTYPATGYGYIELGNMISQGMFHVKQFKEKPDLQRAQSFLESGNFFWNCGIFLWKLKTIQESFQQFYPEGMKIIDQIKQHHYKIEAFFKIRSLYRKLPKLPIDISIMENVEKRAVIPMNVKWSDVGSWYSLDELMKKGEFNNYSSNDLFAIRSESNFVMTNKPVALIDIDDIVLVETDDIIMVTRKKSSEKVKEMVDLLISKGRNELM